MTWYEKNKSKIRDKYKNASIEEVDRRKDYAKAYYEKNKAKILARLKEWRANLPAESKRAINRVHKMRKKLRSPDKYKLRMRAYGRKYWSNLPAEKRYVAGVRRSERKRGVPNGTYSKMFESQCGVCAICSEPSSNPMKRLNIDHCHESGAIRGLLCTGCNTGLGSFRDRKDLLLKAVDYLNAGF